MIRTHLDNCLAHYIVQMTSILSQKRGMWKPVLLTVAFCQTLQMCCGPADALARVPRDTYSKYKSQLSGFSFGEVL